jgi:hypothetical protein
VLPRALFGTARDVAPARPPPFLHVHGLLLHELLDLEDVTWKSRKSRPISGDVERTESTEAEVRNTACAIFELGRGEVMH